MSEIIEITNNIRSLEKQILDYSDDEQKFRRIIAPPGQSGRIGIHGLNGIGGQQGFQGAIGPIGSSGDIGINGLQGNQGSLAAQGYQGLEGLRGYIGLGGDIGLNGSNGLQGFQGSYGLNGQSGSQGFIGNQNNINGNQGQQGFQGSVGSQGITPNRFILRSVEYQASQIEYNIPWPLDSIGNPTPLIFVTMVAGGGGSGGTIAPFPPGAAGGGGGMVRRLPIYYEIGMTNIIFTVGRGGPGGQVTTVAFDGVAGENSTFYIQYTNSSGFKIICYGGGGGTRSALNVLTQIGGYGGGVTLDNTPVGGNLQRIICQNTNGSQIDVTNTLLVPVESSNVNGHYESGSGGQASFYVGLGFGIAITPGAPSITNMRRNVPLFSTDDPVSSTGGTSGLIGYGYGGNTIIIKQDSIGPGLSGADGILILEYYF